jgi:hypothetical protein
MKKIFINNKWLFIVILASIIFRVIASIYLGDSVTDLPGTYDQISYHNLALRVLSGHGFSFGEIWWPITPANAPTAHWSFLYTLYLVATYILFGPHPLIARIIQAVLTGILQPYLAYRIGENLFSKKVGLISAALTAGYAYFIYYDASLMTEPYFITLVMASLYLTILMGKELQTIERNKSFYGKIVYLSVLLGLTLGGAVLLRQLILIFIPFLYLWILWVSRKCSLKNTFTTILIGGAIVFLMVIPFSIYNLSRFGHFVLLNTNSGYAFFWANHPIYGTHFQSILTTTSYQDLIPPELRNLDEAALDQALLNRGFQFVLDDPVRYVLLSLSRIPVYFMFWPSNDSGTLSNISRVASFGWLWPFMLYGVIKSIVDQKMKIVEWFSTPMFLLVCFTIIYTGIHLLSWALIRYRLPVDAVLLVFAGYAFVDLAKRVSTVRTLKLPFAKLG